MVPIEIPDLAIDEELGRGAMGVVYLARQISLDRPVAVKVMPAGQVHPKAIERFLREVKVCVALSHPNVVKLLDAGATESWMYLTMERVDGTSIDRYLFQNGPMRAHQLLAAMDALAGALEFVHAHDILHRDIKPANVMVDRSGVFKLMDFGLARQEGAAPLTAENVLVGSPRYMAPETILEGQYDVLTDLYSLGLVFWEMAVARAPFKAPTLKELFAMIANEPLPAPSTLVPDVPASLDRIIETLCAKDPGSRYPSARALVAAVRRVKESAEFAGVSWMTERPDMSASTAAHLAAAAGSTTRPGASHAAKQVTAAVAPAGSRAPARAGTPAAGTAPARGAIVVGAGAPAGAAMTTGAGTPRGAASTTGAGASAERGMPVAAGATAGADHARSRAAAGSARGSRPEGDAPPELSFSASGLASPGRSVLGNPRALAAAGILAVATIAVVVGVSRVQIDRSGMEATHRDGRGEESSAGALPSASPDGMRAVVTASSGHPGVAASTLDGWAREFGALETEIRKDDAWAREVYSSASKNGGLFTDWDAARATVASLRRRNAPLLDRLRALCDAMGDAAPDLTDASDRLVMLTARVWGQRVVTQFRVDALALMDADLHRAGDGTSAVDVLRGTEVFIARLPDTLFPVLEAFQNISALALGRAARDPAAAGPDLALILWDDKRIARLLAWTIKGAAAQRHIDGLSRAYLARLAAIDGPSREVARLARECWEWSALHPRSKEAREYLAAHALDADCAALARAVPSAATALQGLSADFRKDVGLPVADRATPTVSLSAPPTLPH